VEEKYNELEKKLRFSGMTIEDYASENNTDVAGIRGTIERIVRRDNGELYERNIEKMEANAAFMLQEASEEFKNLTKKKEEEKSSRDRYSQDILSKRTKIKDDFKDKVIPKLVALGYSRDDVVQTYNKMVKTMIVGKNTSVDSYVETLEYGIIGALLPKKKVSEQEIIENNNQKPAASNNKKPEDFKKESLSRGVQDLGFGIKIH
jgi:hypothetical protein